MTSLTRICSLWPPELYICCVTWYQLFQTLKTLSLAETNTWHVILWVVYVILYKKKTNQKKNTKKMNSKWNKLWPTIQLSPSLCCFHTLWHSLQKLTLWSGNHIFINYVYDLHIWSFEIKKNLGFVFYAETLSLTHSDLYTSKKHFWIKM